MAGLLSLCATWRIGFPRLRGQPRGQPFVPNRVAQPFGGCHDMFPFGMRIDGVDLGRLLAEQFHHLIIFRPQLPIVRGGTVPQDVVGHAFRNSRCRGQ